MGHYYKIFLKKYYLKSETIYLEPLKEPVKNFNFFFDLIICKFYYLYLKIFIF